jgi:outer membrane protein OmpA-like peptidoglycan-associated protein
MKTLLKLITLATVMAIAGCSTKTIIVESESDFDLGEKSRYVDNQVEVDREFFESVQLRLYNVSENHYSTQSYPYCMAQGYLDNAVNQYNDNDRTDYVEENLINSIVLTSQLEILPEEIYYPNNNLNDNDIRKDLVNEVNRIKHFLNHYDVLNFQQCGQCTLAQLEVELLNVKHKAEELGLRNALENIKKSEYLYKQLMKEINDCKNNNYYNFVKRSVYFDSDEAILSFSDKRTLTVIADILKENPKTDIVISGYTDFTGEQSYNLKLGEKRAVAVYVYLRNSGVESKRMEIISYGEFKQNENNIDNIEQFKKQNRRVDIDVDYRK